MKCEKIVVISIHADSKGTSLVGLDGNDLITELTNGAASLEKKYGTRQSTLSARAQKVYKLALHSDTSNQPEAFQAIDTTEKKAEIAEMLKFIGDCKDIGMYLLAHYENAHTGFSGSAFDGSALGSFVNALSFTPRKICILACNLARDKTTSDLNAFCSALTKTPKPIVAAYSYPVYVADDGKKQVQPDRSSTEKKLMSEIRDLDRKTPLKVYREFRKEKWESIGHSGWHDDAFAF